jgi:NADP-dependent 3-hydroxy acid dehydrogenase YdfG
VERGVVPVTGCSTGIGRASATALVTAGYTPVATACRPKAIEGWGAALALPVDATDEASITP